MFTSIVIVCVFVVCLRCVLTVVQIYFKKRIFLIEKVVFSLEKVREMDNKKIIIFSCERCSASIFDKIHLRRKEVAKNGSGRFVVHLEHVHNRVSDDNVMLFCSGCRFSFGTVVRVHGYAVALLTRMIPRAYTVSLIHC